MLALGLASDEDNLRIMVSEILTIPMEDGVSFDPAGISIHPHAKTPTPAI
jgi:hypothetical protein